MPIVRPVNPATLKLATATAASGDSVPIYDTSAGQHAKALISDIVALVPAGTGALSSAGVIGRLSSVSATPDPTTDQASPGTVYWTPQAGGLSCALYDGASTWTLFEGITEKSIALSGLTSGKNYDVFAYNNGGTPALELSAAWTTDTARADALAQQNGIYVKSGATTRRWLGTIKATGAATTADTALARYVWNTYNRLPRQVYVHDDTDSWAYGTATWHQTRATAANKIELVCGLTGLGARLDLTANSYAESAAPAGQWGTGIGEDSTTTPMTNTIGRVGTYPATNIGAPAGDSAWAWLKGHPVGTGYHYYAWLEIENTGGGATFYGDNGGTLFKTGMTGTWLC